MLAEARAILEPRRRRRDIPRASRATRAQLRVHKPPQGQLNGELTERELEVLRLLVSGLTTRQIARNRYVAPSTVKTQIKSIYRKLGVSSREEAAERLAPGGLSNLLDTP